jgi:Tol biopolymer transport system component
VPIAEVGGSAHQVVRSKIYFLTLQNEGGTRQPTIWSYDMLTEEVRQLAVLDASFNWHFSISPNGDSILYDKWEQGSSDLMLVENFR